MKQLTFVQTRDMLLHVADQVIDSKAFLTEIDSKIGDGDHGIGMERGMKKAKEKLLPMENGDNVFSLFQEMGKTMLMSMGGASGVIFGTLFMGGAKGKTASSLTASGLISLMEDSLRSIQERGKAQTGDKTMVDALVPAVDSMKNSGSDDLGELLSAAAEAEDVAWARLGTTGGDLLVVAGTDLLAEGVQVGDHRAEFGVDVRVIHNHHHVEEAVDDGLGNVKHVDVVFGQIRADAGDDADGVLADDGDDGLVHAMVSLVLARCRLIGYPQYRDCRSQAGLKVWSLKQLMNASSS